MLDEAGSKYGDNIIDDYSQKLVVEVGKKYNRRTIFRMKQFYNMFSDEKSVASSDTIDKEPLYRIIINKR